MRNIALTMTGGRLVGAPIAAAKEAAPLFPLTVRGLTYITASRRLIDGLDLNLGPDGITVVMGPNGAGKSLMLRLLHGLLQPTSGTIAWGGQPVTSAVQARQSMVFQKPVLLRRSVAENIDFVLRLRGLQNPMRRDALLRQVGLETLSAQPARRLSGGEQQRLSLARALATDPDVLLLDEPTASLDPASVLLIEQIIGSARDSGVRIVFVTHDPGQARRLADDVVFLHRGRVAEHAPADRFFDAPQSTSARDYLAGRIVL